MELNERHKLFIDEWLKDHNGSRAYKVAYPHIKKDSTAEAAASRLLRDVKVSAYRDKRLAELHSERTMDLEELIERSSSIARGEPQKRIREVLNPETGEIVERDVERWTPKVEDQQRSQDHLYKVYGAFDKKDKNETNSFPDISGLLAPIHVDKITNDE